MSPRPRASYQYVDNDAAVESLIRRMELARRVALDTEADSLHHYFQKVCLLQLTIDGENYIVDPLSGTDLEPFLRVLADKSLILHGGDYDLRMMRLSFGFRPKNEVFDTLLAAQLLGYEQLGLVSLVEHFFDVPLTKHGQKSDWTRRPLTGEQLQYASDDTRYLEPLANRLHAELHKLGRDEWHRESCERMVRSTGNQSNRNPEEAWRIKGLRFLDRRQLALVRELWHWREREAIKANRPPFKIMGNQRIVELAIWASEHRKTSLRRGPKLPRHCTGQRFKALEKAVHKALSLPESEWPDHRKPKPQIESVPDFKPQMRLLREECARIAGELGIDPAVIASRATLAAVVRNRPRTEKETMALSSMMRWQVKLLKPAIDRIMATLADELRNVEPETHPGT